MRQLKRKFDILTEEQYQTKRDYPLIKQNILKFSQSNIYEEANKEWTLIDIIDNEDANFVDRCEICNQPGLTKNYIILNMYNNSTLRVGSNCIKRFLYLEGSTTQQQSLDIFDLEPLHLTLRLEGRDSRFINLVTYYLHEPHIGSFQP